jgi:hypothetical protein
MGRLARRLWEAGIFVHGNVRMIESQFPLLRDQVRASRSLGYVFQPGKQASPARHDLWNDGTDGPEQS